MRRPTLVRFWPKDGKRTKVDPLSVSLFVIIDVYTTGIIIVVVVIVLYYTLIPFIRTRFIKVVDRVV